MDADIEAYNKLEKKLLEEHHGEIAIFCGGRLLAIAKDIKEAFKKANVPEGAEIFVKEILKPEASVLSKTISGSSITILSPTLYTRHFPLISCTTISNTLSPSSSLLYILRYRLA